MNMKLFAAFFLVAAASIAGCSTATAQNARISLPEFGPLESKSKDCVNVTLGPWMLHSVGLFLDDSDPDDAAAKQILNGLESIQIRSFEFDSDNAYSAADLAAVRRQLDAPGWTSLMNVHDRDHKKDVDMYIMIQNEQTRGFALIASEPRRFTIVNIVGSIKMSDLPKLQKHLHVDGLHWPAAAAQL
jgi:hypothetical protein